MREKLAAAPGMRCAKRTEQPIAPRSHLAAQACQSPRLPSILRVGPCSWLAMSASRTRASLRRGKSHARADQVSHTLAGYLRCRSSSPPGPAIVGAARYLFMLPRPLDTNLIAQRPTQAQATGRCPRAERPAWRRAFPRFIPGRAAYFLAGEQTSSSWCALCPNTHAHAMCLECMIQTDHVCLLIPHRC